MRIQDFEPKPLVVTPKDACRLLSVGVTRLYEMIDAGDLKSFKDGRSRRIVLASIESYVERKAASA